MKGKIFTPPNIITFVRILLIPAFAAVMFANMIWGLVIFLICASTDLVDGYVARRYNMVSDLGKLLDPVADKLMHITVMVCLSVIYGDKIPPFYILTIIIAAKELLMLLVGLFLITKRVVVPANIYGKAASFLLSIGVFVIFFGEYSAAAYLAGFIVSSIAVAIALLALAIYAAGILKALGYKVPDGAQKMEIVVGKSQKTAVGKEQDEAQADTDNSEKE
ncbi:MAG: CDP-alcohol phosphatidyltransferase family protein [Clostridiales bacterium]|nr:CDP-alcohol phosphatidyltransferase family protein [Clostridiales bacterium]